MADTTKDIWNDDDGQERRPKKRRKLPGILLFFLTLAVVLAVVLVAAITDWIMVVIAAYIPLGIQWPGILLPLVLAWYILTELGSVLENAAALGAKVPNWLIKLLKASADLVEAAGEETNRDTESEEGHEREGQ